MLVKDKLIEMGINPDEADFQDILKAIEDEPQMTTHKEVERLITDLENAGCPIECDLAIKPTINFLKKLIIIKPNTTTIPTAEYEQLLADKDNAFHMLAVEKAKVVRYRWLRDEAVKMLYAIVQARSEI